jgi:hypothetical protein
VGAGNDRALPRRPRARPPPRRAAARALGLRADARAACPFPSRHDPGHGRRLHQVDHLPGLDDLRAAPLLRIERPLRHGLQLPRGHGRPARVPRAARCCARSATAASA